jgi:hypothetical protein
MTRTTDFTHVPGLVVPGLVPAARYPLTETYWARADEGLLVLQQCAQCGTFRHPPAPVCFRCQSFEWNWTQVSGAGTVFSMTWVHAALTPAFADVVPYNVCVVELDDTPAVGSTGVRIAATVTGVELGADLIDTRVRAFFADAGDGNRLLLFAPA